MRCLNEEMISSYIDQVLDPQEQQEVQEHLRECWQCRRVLKDYQALSAKICELPDLPVPDEFRRNLMGKLEAPKRSKFSPKWAGLAAAVLLVALAVPGFNLFAHRQKGAPISLQESSGTNQARSLAKAEFAGGGPQSEAQAPATPQAAAPQDVAGKEINGASQQKSADAVDTSKGINPERNLNLELRVQQVESATQLVLKQTLQIPGAGVISTNAFLKDQVKVQVRIPGPETQRFLSGLATVGTVKEGAFTGNIGEDSGINIITILISKAE